MTVSEIDDEYEQHRWQPSDEDREWMAEMAREYDTKPATGLHVVNNDDDGAATSAAIEHLLPLVDWDELFAQEDEGERWICEPLLAEGRSTALFSAPKAGKSLLVLEIAVNVSRGFAVLGMKPPRPYRVLYVDLENDMRGDVRQRLEAMGYDHDMIKEGALANLCYLSYPSLSKLDSAQGGAELLAAVEHYRCDVVIIDTVSRIVAGEENSNDTWLNLYRHTGLAMKQRGVAMLRLDHSGKDAEKGMRGGSAKSGDVDMAWRLTPMSESVLHLDCVAHRMPVESAHLELVRETEPDLYHRVAAGHERVGISAMEKEILADIEALQLAPERSANDVYTALRAAGKGRKKRAVLRVVRMWKEQARTAESGSGTTPVPDPREPPLREPPGTTTKPQVTGISGGSGTTGNQVVPTPIGWEPRNREPGTGCRSGAPADVHRAGACDCWTPGEAS
ncbi:AAA family ATPase [Nocardioides sp. NPDC006273]|uniref:AAA family ATPase n=1 Tax=Nocardioides sp. NPDC006273 TaxID=3155598 RepID=UPI0033ACE267